jgi:hypothetical protein
MTRAHTNWSGQQMLTPRVNPGQVVNTILTAKSYARSAPVSFFAGGCGAGCIGDAPVFVLAVSARSQNEPGIMGILFVSEWRHCVLTLYFGPAFLTEPDFIALAIAIIPAAVRAAANAGPGLVRHGARAHFKLPRITHATPPCHAPGEDLP